MGNCFDADQNEDIVFQGFRNDMQNNEMNYEKVCLFGLAGSGKSTLYLNLQQLYDDTDYNHKQQLKHCEAIIRSNCLLYIAVLVNESEKLYDKTQNDLYHIDYNNKSIADAIQLITKYIPYNFDKYTPAKPIPIINDTQPLKPTIKPIASITATVPSQPPIQQLKNSSHSQTQNQLPVLEEKKVISGLDVTKNFSFESIASVENGDEKKPLPVIEQANVDSSGFMSRFNIDDSQQHKDDAFYKEHTLKDESKNVQMHNIMESDDQSYLTIENMDSNKAKNENEVITLATLGNDHEQEEHEIKQGLYIMQNDYMEELGYLISEYDDLVFDEMGIDLWNYQNNSWKNKFDDKNLNKNEKKYQFEAYKPFDFDEYYSKEKEWEKLQSQNHNNHKRNGRIKYFDEETDEYSSDNDIWTHSFKRKNNYANYKKNDEMQTLNEELIEDFGAYYEYMQIAKKTENNGTNMKQKQWSEFGHKAAIIAKYFNMKLNHKLNPIKHEYEIIGEQWWNPHKNKKDNEFSMKKLDIVLKNKIKISKLSNYDSSDESCDEEDIKTKNDTKDKVLRYKVDIVNGKIKKMEQWDTKVMQTKENVMAQLINRTNSNDNEISMEENKEEKKVEQTQTQTQTQTQSENNKDIESEIKEESKNIMIENNSNNVLEVNGEKISIKQFWNEMKKLGESVKKIWNLPAIKQTYLKRFNLFYFPSNMEYWFYNSTKIFSYHFTAANQHLSLYRNYCTQIQTFKFNDTHGPKVRVFDIPSTTPEIRKKYWTRQHCANCDAIIFTASLIDIFGVSFEQPMKNAFYLSIELFYEILHSDWLNKGCKIILFLTHRDTLIEYIRNGHSIKTFTKNFNQWNWRPNSSNHNNIGFKSDIEMHHNNDNKLEINKSDMNNISNNKSAIINDNTINTEDAEDAYNKSIDKTLNTIDAMHNTFDRFIQSIEEKEEKEMNNGKSLLYKNTLSEGTFMDGNGITISRNSSLNKERDGTITKFMPELSEDILSDDSKESKDILSHSTKEKETTLKINIVSCSDITADMTKENIENNEHKMDDEEEEEEKKIMISNENENENENTINNYICKCPTGHALEEIICENSNYYMCDECRADLLEGQNQFQCRIDNYDLCQTCYDKLLLAQKDKLQKELEKTPVWIIDEYNGVEYMDRLNTPKSDVERILEKEKKEKQIQIQTGNITPDSKENNKQFVNVEEKKEDIIVQERKDNKILTQFKKQTRKRDKNRNQNNNNKSLMSDMNEYSENWKYILSGNKKLTYDGSSFDDDRWLIQTYNGYCEWMRNQFMKCKDINDQRVIHCHILNLVNQDDVEKVMYDLNNYVFRNVFHNDWMF